MSEESIKRGACLAQVTIQSMQLAGKGSSPLCFYTSMVGALMGHITAKVGKGASLAILETITTELFKLSTKDSHTADRAEGGECCWTLEDHSELRGLYQTDCGYYLEGKLPEHFYGGVCERCQRPIHIKES